MIRLFLVCLLSVLLSLRVSLSFADSDTNKFDIGIVIPLTGDLAEYGSAIRNGFEFAQQQFPEKLKAINFRYEDSRYDGKTAVEALQKLRSSNSIELYYLWGVSPTEAMLPIAASQKLAVVAETTVKEATVGKPLVIRAARTGERLAKALASEIKRREIKSVSLIVTEIPFYTDIVKHLEVALESESIVVRRKLEILPTENDFKSFLLGRSTTKGEALGVFLLPSQLITFYRQADRAKLSLATFNADILDSETIVSQCPDNINGTFFTQVGVTKEFREAYKSKFGDDIQLGSAAQAYDFANLIGELFADQSKKLSAEEVISTISRMNPHSGTTGSFSYFETDDAGKEIRMPISMKVVKNKKIEVIDENTGF